MSSGLSFLSIAEGEALKQGTSRGSDKKKKDKKGGSSRCATCKHPAKYLVVCQKSGMPISALCENCAKKTGAEKIER